jgi:hypothetical protein
VTPWSAPSRCADPACCRPEEHDALWRSGPVSLWCPFTDGVPGRKKAPPASKRSRKLTAIRAFAPHRLILRPRATTFGRARGEMRAPAAPEGRHDCRTGDSQATSDPRSDRRRKLPELGL